MFSRNYRSPAFTTVWGFSASVKNLKKQWKWDQIKWVSHNVQRFPTNQDKLHGMILSHSRMTLTAMSLFSCFHISLNVRAHAAELEAILGILVTSNTSGWLTGKDPDAGRDWGQEEKGTTEDEMAGWPHQLDGLGFGWTPGVGDGQGGLACCDSRGRKELDTTERLNWTPVGQRGKDGFQTQWSPGLRKEGRAPPCEQILLLGDYEQFKEVPHSLTT